MVTVAHHVDRLLAAFGKMENAPVEGLVAACRNDEENRADVFGTKFFGKPQDFVFRRQRGEFGIQVFCGNPDLCARLRQQADFACGDRAAAYDQYGAAGEVGENGKIIHWLTPLLFARTLFPIRCVAAFLSECGSF